MKDIDIEEKVQEVEMFFEDHKECFDIPVKKAVFLVGVLTKLLLDHQHKTRGSEPFRAKLMDLNLNERKVKKLLKDIEVKLAQYNLRYGWLKEMIGKYLVEVGCNWEISNDEISYYFVLGLTLGRIFRR
jgi:CRISPR-associated protein Csh1